MRFRTRLRASRGPTWTLLWIASALVLLGQAIGLVSPRSGDAARDSSDRLTLEGEPPPAALVEPAAPDAAAPAPRALAEAREAPTAAAPRSDMLAEDGSDGPRARLKIRVTRAGLPAPRASVEIVHEPSDGSAPPPSLVQTDDDGRLALALAPGSVRAAAWSADECALPVHAELAVGEATQLELELEPAYPVAGRVVDAASGAPVADARVSLWTFAERDEVTTGPDGTFRHPRFPARAPGQQITAHAEGYGRDVRYLRIGEDGSWKLSARTAEETSVRGSGVPWVELVLVPELRVRGHVHDPLGRGVAGATISIEGFFHALPSVAARDGTSIATDELGAFELRGLRSDIGHALLVQAPGCAEQALELPAGSVALDTIVVTLDPESVLTGAVLDPDGLPVADAEVVLRVARELPERLPGSLDAGTRIRDRQWRTRTGADGTFLFEGLAPTPCVVSVEHDPFARSELELVPLPDGSFVPLCLNLMREVRSSEADEVAAR